MAQRWDRDRFERMRGSGGHGGRGGGASEHDYYRFEERDHVGPHGRHEVMVDERIEKRGPRGRFEERERFIEEDRLPARGPAPRFLDDPVPPEVARQALAPYRRPRPQFIRRQSSLDTFDRKPMPRYGDEYRAPAEVPIPLPIRRPHSPRRGGYYEEFEERYRGSEEDYRDVRIREERRGDHRSRSRMRSRSVRRRRSLSSSSDSSFEEVNKSSIVGRKGRTKLPKRLAHKSAIIELGYPYVEEENFIIVQRALDKTHIDNIVEISKKYKTENKTVIYKYEGKTDGTAPASKKEEKKTEVKETKKEEVKKEEFTKSEIKPDGTKVEEKVEIKETKPVAPVASAPAKAPAAGAGYDHLKKTTTTTTTTIDPPDHHHHHQDLAVVVPRRMTEHDLQREIEALEAERRALRYERESDWEIVEHRGERRKDIYRVERDRKARSRSRAPSAKVVGLAMAALS